MARDRKRLLNFQEALGVRLKQAAAQPKRDSRLAVVSGGKHFLLNLDDIAEVSPAGQMTQVPFTKQWFMGVTNVRGTLYAVSDFAAWLLGRKTALGETSQLVLLGQRLSRFRTAILVERVIGLRLLDDMSPVADVAKSEWENSIWRDKSGTDWYELDLAKLLMNNEFLQVVKN
jgi:twitching motility protein PilI